MLRKKTMRCLVAAIFSIGVQAMTLKEGFAASTPSEELFSGEKPACVPDAADERSSREKKLNSR